MPECHRKFWCMANINTKMFGLHDLYSNAGEIYKTNSYDLQNKILIYFMI